MQHYLNRCVVGLACVLSVFCLYAATSGVSRGVRLNDAGTGLVRSSDGQSPDGGDFVVTFLVYWIILYHIVPISLYVCFEIVKLSLGFQINLDRSMVDKRSGEGAVARTADLVEEVGQVGWVFSDKTGTLTENEMRFARACVGGQDFGEFRADVAAQQGGATTQAAATTSEVEGVANVQKAFSCEESTAPVMKYFIGMATCHNAQVQMTGGEPRYSGSSPDEVALLEAAHKVGVSFVSRRIAPNGGGHHMEVRSPRGLHDITVLAEIPFSSDRKRMTVVCASRDTYWCVTKGADSVVAALCEEPLDEASQKQLTTYAKLGLRTLVLASREIEWSFFQDWQEQLVAAQQAGNCREEMLERVYADMEHSLTLLGVSAIEDRLQEGVPAAIEQIQAMGIPVWILTGDKVETAVEIARSCNLFVESMELTYLVGAEKSGDAKRMLQQALPKLMGLTRPGLVLDSSFVRHALAEPDLRRTLYEVALACQACVCCRLSPEQKRKLVELVRDQDRSCITLAIGDGANDVSMIQGAHVGIGVRGKEGNQAVQSSDIAISQFRFLTPLLLRHGRRAYRRVATFLCYYVYKHVVLAVGDMVWASQCSFQGQIAYPEWLSSAYSTLFTSLPILFICAFDRDLPDEVVDVHPELYTEGPRRLRFNLPIFSSWVVGAVWHGALAWLVPSLAFGSSSHDDGEFWLASVASFTLVVVNVSLRLWIVSLNRFSPMTLFVLSFSFVLYIFTLLVLGHTMLGEMMQPQMEGVPIKMLSSPKALAAVGITAVVVLTVDALLNELSICLRPLPLDNVRRGNPARVIPSAEVGGTDNTVRGLSARLQAFKIFCWK